MDADEFMALSEEAGSVPGFGKSLRVEAQSRPHPVLEHPSPEIVLRIVDAEPDPATGARRYDVEVSHEPHLEVEAHGNRALLFGLERVAERAAADDAIASDEALFQAHAGFLRGMEVPAGWYRRGESMDEEVWAVDLDVFVDLVVPRETWASLKGGRATLRILGDELELEVPEDADPEEAFTLEGGGLFEPAAGIEEDELAEDDGRYGDLHIVPYVF